MFVFLQAFVYINSYFIYYLTQVNMCDYAEYYLFYNIC